MSNLTTAAIEITHTYTAEDTTGETCAWCKKPARFRQWRVSTAMSLMGSEVEPLTVSPYVLCDDCLEKVTQL